MPLDEKDQLRMEQRIRAAFRGVSRAGGVSWSEAAVIDDYGSDKERAAARLDDADASWEELVEDAAWVPDQTYGGFSFPDAIGFKYYLAPALIRSVRSGEDGGIRFFLSNEDADELWLREKRSLLDKRQQACVRDFLVFMKDWAAQQGSRLDAEWWTAALRGGGWDTLD